MNLELYIAFVAATVALMVLPGPNVGLIVANALTHGPRYGLVTVAGTQCAQALQLVVVVAGMTSVVAQAANAFEIVRWLGVVYLLWLGLTRWRAGAPVAAVAGRGRAFWQGFAVSATNPKVLFFYAAFFPQFIDPARAPGPQLVGLAVTFLAVAAIVDGGYAIAAGRAQRWFLAPRRWRAANRITGAALIGTGVWLAFARRA